MKWYQVVVVWAWVALAGCQLSREDAWDNKHKRLPPVTVRVQLSAAAVTAGESVTVRCAVSQGERRLDAIPTTLQVAAATPPGISEHPDDPQVRTLVPEVAGDYDITCAAPQGPDGTDLAAPSVKLEVAPGPAARFKIGLLQSQPRAGERVGVTCRHVDRFGNVLRGAPPGEPGLSVEPEHGVFTDRTSLSATLAGTYTVQCRSEGSVAASLPEEGRLTVTPGEPSLWWDKRRKQPVDALPTLQCITSDADFTPEFELRDAFGNPVALHWQILRESNDGAAAVVAASAARQAGMYRYTPLFSETPRSRTLEAFEVRAARHPAPPDIAIDDALRTPARHIRPTPSRSYNMRVADTCGVQDGQLDGVRQDLPQAADSVSLAYTVDPNAWGLRHVRVRATNGCGVSAERLQSYIVSPRFERPEAWPASFGLAWDFSDASLRTLVQDGWRRAWAAEPGSVDVETEAVRPAPVPEAAGREAWAPWLLKQVANPATVPKLVWSTLGFGGHPAPEAPAMVAEAAVRAHYTGVPSFSKVGIDKVEVDARGRLTAHAAWTDVTLAGSLVGEAAEAVAFTLHLPRVHGRVSATVQGETLRDIHVEVPDLGPPEASRWVPNRPSDGAPWTFETLPAELAEALRDAWAPAWAQALAPVQSTLGVEPRESLRKAYVAQHLATTCETHGQDAPGVARQTRVRYYANGWYAPAEPGVAVHPVAAVPPVDSTSARDRLIYSDDGINALMWSVWAAEGFMERHGLAPLPQVVLQMPVLWMPGDASDPGTVWLGAAARVQVGTDGRYLEGDLHVRLPVRLVWADNRLQVQASAAQRGLQVPVADAPGAQAAFEAAVERSEFESWLITAVNAALMDLPRPRLLEPEAMPKGCRWEADAAGLRRAAEVFATTVEGTLVCTPP